MKQLTLLTVFLLVIVLFSSCTYVPAVTDTILPVPSSPAQVTVSADVTPAPTLTPILTTAPSATDGGNVVLSNEQSDKIDALLTGALNMYDEGKATFQDASILTSDELLRFTYTILNDVGALAGLKTKDTGTVSADVVQYIIRSAFGVDYTPRKGDSYSDLLRYKGGSYILEGSDPQLTFASPYSITRQPSGSLLLKFDIVYDAVPETDYFCKGEAVLQEDGESLFGYRLVSLAKAASVDIAFTSAEASSCLSADGSRTYGAENAIDGVDNTAWATNGGKGEWIKLTFDKPQDITGLILHFSDWSSEDAFNEHACSVSFQIDFSDGTFVNDGFENYNFSGDPCITFGKEINTSYVKITYTTTSTDTLDSNIYVSEIKPF